MQKITNVSVNRLFLDPQNPRHFPIEDQKNIIAFFIENEKVKELAKDIAEKGLTNPLDIVGIATENNRLIVLEGNRRVCALKLLLKPSLAPKKYQKFFENLKQKILHPITRIPVYPFHSREEASPWLATLHSKSSKTSRKSWSTEQQTRFEQLTNGKPEHSSALTILEFALENELIQPAQAQKVITTVSRMLSSPEVREAFGIITGVREKMIEINITQEEFKQILVQYFSDLDSKEHNIGSRSNKTDRLHYLEHLRSLGKLPQSRLSDSIKLMPHLEPAHSSPEQPTPLLEKQKKRHFNRHRGRLIDYELDIPISKIKAIYQELKTKLKVAETPYAIAALLRAIVEQSCDYFLLQTRQLPFHQAGRTEMVTEGSPLRLKILSIAQYLKQQGDLEEKELSALTNECQPKAEGFGTLNLLNGVLHNYAHNITSEQVEAAHNNLKPFLIAIWNKYSWPSEK